MATGVEGLVEKQQEEEKLSISKRRRNESENMKKINGDRSKRKKRNGDVIQPL